MDILNEIKPPLKKYVVLCVDQSCSMGYTVEKGRTIMDCVNEGIREFRDRLVEMENNMPDTFQKLPMVFPMDGGNVVPGAYAAMMPGDRRAEKGTLVSNALRGAAQMIVGRPGVPIIVFVSDGILEPQESEADLRDTIAKLRFSGVKCLTAGFHTDGRETSLECLLDNFTGRRMITWTDSTSYRTRFDEIYRQILAYDESDMTVVNSQFI